MAIQRCPCGALDLDEGSIGKFMDRYMGHNPKNLPGILERTKARFWDEEDSPGQWESLHRIEALRRLLVMEG